MKKIVLKIMKKRERGKEVDNFESIIEKRMKRMKRMKRNIKKLDNYILIILT